MSDGNSEFRDVLIQEVRRSFNIGQPYDFVADAILATPEMQAIRRALLYEAKHLAARSSYKRATPARFLKDLMGLPASVVEWVMGDE